jgi:hypothetical protein
LLSAFDGAIATVRRLAAGGMITATGASAAPLLAKLERDLEARRKGVASGESFDREWAGQVVRWVAEWVPEQELPLIARLGQIVRHGTGG